LDSKTRLKALYKRNNSCVN